MRNYRTLEEIEGFDNIETFVGGISNRFEIESGNMRNGNAAHD